MYNSYKRTSSQPITIEPSSSSSDRNDRNRQSNATTKTTTIGSSSSASIMIRNDNNYQHDNHYVEDEEEEYESSTMQQQHAIDSHHRIIDHNHVFTSSTTWMDDLHNSSNQLTVGSLPSSRRERRFLVSHGKQERLHDGSVVPNHYSGARRMGSRHGHGHGHGFGHDGIGGGYDLSKSMPVPRAPFLASRKDGDVGERMSRIPNMSLPESVTECAQASSVPYGSLNESQFRLPWSSSSSNHHHHHDKTNVPAASSYNPTSTLASSLSSSSTPSGQQLLDIRKKFQQMRMEGSLIKNDQGGLASLLGRNHVTTQESSLSLSSKKSPASHTLSSSSSSYMGTGGIGSLLGQESNSSQQQQQQQPQQQQRMQQEDTHNIPFARDDAFHDSSLSGTTLSLHHSDTPQKVKASSPSLSPSSSHPFLQDTLQNNHENVVQLSTSLTGLSILKTSPKGLVDLDPEEREAIAIMRSRSHSSGDGNAFLRRKPPVETEPVLPSIPVAYHRSGGVVETLGEKDASRRRFSMDGGSDDHYGGGEQGHDASGGGGGGENESDEFFNLDM